MTYTYDRKLAAWLNAAIVTIPDEVFDNQRVCDLNGTAFPARRADGSQVMVRLNGEAYGLHTTGTGDPVVTSVALKECSDDDLLQAWEAGTLHDEIKVEIRKRRKGRETSPHRHLMPRDRIPV